MQSLRPKGQCSLARDPNGLPVRVLKEWVTTHEEQCHRSTCTESDCHDSITIHLDRRAGFFQILVELRSEVTVCVERIFPHVLDPGTEKDKISAGES